MVFGTMDSRSLQRRAYDILSFTPGLQAFLKGPLREFLRRPATDRKIASILDSDAIHPAYRLSRRDKIALGRAFICACRCLHSTNRWDWMLAVALRILETPPPSELPGDVIECGTYKGGSAACLSLVCRIVGRRLLVCDSFQGLPSARPGDRHGPHFAEGEYLGTLKEVRESIHRYGAPECCEFVEGWLEDTLPGLRLPVVAAFLDVVLEASLDACVRGIWPRLVDEGLVFLAECGGPDFAALFWSEKWWRKHFDRTPPGMVGEGEGSFGYTTKSMSGYWSYYPDEEGRCDSKTE